MNFESLFQDVADHSRGPREPVVAGLSGEQMAALNAPFNQSAVVCAGAGSGKTRVLAERVARLLRLGANPQRVAVVTFTRRASKEMRLRIQKLVLDEKKLPVIGTVHALALSVMARRKIPFVLASEEQQLECVAALADLLPADFEPLSPHELLLEISRAREAAEPGSIAGMLAQVYDRKLDEQGLGDFTSLLARAAKNPPDLFDHVIVDETQDLSMLQLEFLRGIGPRAKYWFIGDDDQAIYSFRGAGAGMMGRLQLEVDATYTLATNFRSARQIVDCANNVISLNANRMPIAWAAHRQDDGEVSVLFHDHESDEQAAAHQWLREAPEQRCVLARTRALVEDLRHRGLNAFSVHESKGLEWDEVMVLGCEAALFPHPLAGLPEERRLFYVAMTRARNVLHLSSCGSRESKNPGLRTRKPSPFLYELQGLQAKS